MHQIHRQQRLAQVNAGNPVFMMMSGLIPEDASMRRKFNSQNSSVLETFS
jgi:hypothetical protein